MTWYRRLALWLRSRDTYVSETWLDQNCLSDTKAGWDGPRWRTPKEIQAMREDEQ